ncbi:MAG: glycosyltransferase family 39 protein [Candidatus Thiodiazotropha sp.]
MFTGRDTATRTLISIALLLVTVAGFARFYDMQRMIVWHDEVFSVIRVLGFDHAAVRHSLFAGGEDLNAAQVLRYQSPDPALGWSDTWQALRGHPEHPPLFFLLARLSVEPGEQTVLGIRATSALLSLLLFPALAWWARELFGRGPAPWLALVLLALSPVHLLFAQEARQYALWSVLIAASSAALLRALRSDSACNWSLYALLMSLALYTHLLSGLLIAVHLIYVGWRGLGDKDLQRSTLRHLGYAITAALVAFLPWMLLIVDGYAALQQFTQWMSQTVSTERLTWIWLKHLSRPFIDLPGYTWSVLLLIPVLFAIVLRAHREPSEKLLWTMLLIWVLSLLLPDLLLGGRRSLESRYLLPAFLAIEMLLVGAIHSFWQAGVGSRRIAIALLALLSTAGLLSQWQILHADTWWTKSLSAGNAELARIINHTDQPLVLVDAGASNLGEIISLSYRLDAKVRLRIQTDYSDYVPPADATALFALSPGMSLRRRLDPDFRFEQLPGSWQWYRIVRRGG